MMKKLLKISVFSLGLGLVLQSAALSATIGFFNNTQYVVPEWNDNLKNILLSFGHTVNEFTSVETSAWQRVAQENELLIIPSLKFPEEENQVLIDSLSPATRNIIRQYVSGGGGFIMAGSDVQGYLFWDEIFGFSGLETNLTGFPFFLNEANAAGTIFANGPNELEIANLVVSVAMDSLPVGAKSIYDNRDNSSGLFVTPYGLGKTANIGFDFFSPSEQWTEITNLTVEFVAGTPLPLTSIPEPSLLVGFMAVGLSASFIGVKNKE